MCTDICRIMKIKIFRAKRGKSIKEQKIDCRTFLFFNKCREHNRVECRILMENSSESKLL